MDPSSLLPREEIERVFSIESAREKAAAEYSLSPLDAENLSKWGSLLMELAQFRKGQAAINIVEEAISKFQEALQLKPRKHDIRWNLGTAYSSHGFLVSDSVEAYHLFRQATTCFQQALDEDPCNVHYLRSLELSMKAPSLYHELQKQQEAKVKRGFSEEVKGGFFSSLKYDAIGWIVLAVGIAAWANAYKSGFPPPRFK